MKVKYTAAASSFVLALAMAGTAGAAGMGKSGGTSFNDLDKDGDGKVSMQEAQDKPELIDQWSSVDTNADNEIDQAEFSAFEAEQGTTGGTGSDPYSSPGGTGGGSMDAPSGSPGGMGSDPSTDPAAPTGTP